MEQIGLCMWILESGCCVHALWVWDKSFSFSKLQFHYSSSLYNEENFREIVGTPMFKHIRTQLLPEWWHTLVTWNSGSKGVRSRTSGANLRYLMGHCWKFLSGKVAQWTNKDGSGDLQNKKGVLKEERECRRMLEYTNFNQIKPAKDVQAGNSGRSPDVKAGFLDVPALPEGSQGRDFLLEQARYLRKSRALDPGSALTRGKSLLSQHPAPDYSIAEARAPASCPHAGPGRRPGLPPWYAFRSTPETAERVRHATFLDRWGSGSQNKPDSAETRRDLSGKFPGSGMDRPRSGDFLRLERWQGSGATDCTGRKQF